jgi:hypothetical protein
MNEADPSMLPRLLVVLLLFGLRPWKTKAQFDKATGKYVGSNETARLWRFRTVK